MIRELSKKNQYVLCYGHEGSGKTSIARKLYENTKHSLYIDLKNSLLDFIAIPMALNKKIGNRTDNFNYLLRYLNSHKRTLIIVDHLETFSAVDFLLIYNLIKINAKSQKVRLLVFCNMDLIKQRQDNKNYEKLFNDFDRIYTIKPTAERLEDYITLFHEKKCANLDNKQYQQILEDANYNIAAIIQIFTLKKQYQKRLTKEEFSLLRYNLLMDNIKLRLNMFSDERMQIINKTATVGFTFNTEFINACFQIVELDTILKDIMSIDNKLYKEIQKSSYSFYNEETRQCIYGLLSEPDKLCLNRSIFEYCIKKANNLSDIFEKINYLSLAYFHIRETTSFDIAYKIGCCLLKLYEKIHNYTKILELVEDLISFTENDELSFLRFYYVNLLMERDCFVEANIIIDQINQYNCSLKKAATFRYLNLFYIKNLYLSSSSKKATQMITKMLEELPQNIDDHVFLFYLYSLASSIYDNNGNYIESIKNIKKANYEANICISEKYKNLLRVKCQIHGSKESRLNDLYQAIQYFSAEKNENLLAQAQLNFGSELFFQGMYSEAKVWIGYAYDYFKKKGSVWISYAANNLAIIDIICHDYHSAIDKLEMPLPPDTELFTKITILCNKLICYLKMKNTKRAQAILQSLVKETEGTIETDSLYINVYLPLIEALYYYHTNDINKAYDKLKEIQVPEYYDFIQEFIWGLLNELCDNPQLHNYSNSYIKTFVKERIYLCDLLFIE